MIRFNERLQRAREEDGFTLIELMVVVLIIGILIAIAIPTFLGARQRAQDRAAQSSLRNALTNAKAIYTDSEKYTDATATLPVATSPCAAGVDKYASRLICAEPALTFAADGTTSLLATDGPNKVSVHATDKDNFVAAVYSAAGTCWFIHDGVSPSAQPGTQWAKAAAATNCNGSYGSGKVDGTWTKTPGDSALPQV